MGWCSGTHAFDAVCEILLTDKPIDKKQALKKVITKLHELDWDCESDSDYWDHPLVQEIFREMYPDWFDDE